MPRLFTFLLLPLLLFSCNKEEKPDRSPAFLDQNALQRAKLHAETIEASVFQAVQSSDSSFTAVKRLCEESKGYQSNTWEGLNDCSWAVEKARIARYSNVSRESDRLILQKGGDTLVLRHELQDGQPKRYVQFSGYLPANNYYIIEYLKQDQCTETKLIHRDSVNEYLLKGRTLVYGPEEKLLLYSQGIGNNSTCFNELAYYGWSEEGLRKYWELPLREQKIGEVKTGDKGDIYLELRRGEQENQQVTYLKIQL